MVRRSLVGVAMLAVVLPVAAIVPARQVAAAGPSPTRTTLVSRSDGNPGTAGNNGAEPSVSADGRFVAFESNSPLSGEPTGGNTQVFVRDRYLGRTYLASRADGPSGAVPNDSSDAPSISADGRYVAFQSRAHNLVLGFVPRPRQDPCVESPPSSDTHVPADVFVRDLVSGTTVLISHIPGSATTPGSAYSDDPKISADGSRVIFASAAVDLTSTPEADRGCDPQLFAAPRAGGDAVLASRADGASGAMANGLVESYAVSGDGAATAFATQGTNLTSDTTLPDEVYVRYLSGTQSGRTVLVSRAAASGGSDGGPGNDGTGQCACGAIGLSSDGNLVVFQSEATNLGYTTDGVQQIYERDIGARALALVSRTDGASGAAGNGGSGPGAVSSDGRYVAFETLAPNLGGAGTDTSGTSQVDVRDVVAGTTVLASRSDPSVGTSAGNRSSADVAISADGQSVAMESTSTNLTADDTHAGAQVFVRGNGIEASIFADAASSDQYTLTNSDGLVWTAMDAVKLSRTIVPVVGSTVIVGGNADLFTNSPGYNQDIGIFMRHNSDPERLLAWKESGGFAGIYSPNAAFVQTVVTQMVAGDTYVFTLKWKTNKAEPGGVVVYAGAGSGSPFSPTRLSLEVLPTAASPATVVSTDQYTLTGSDGRNWNTMDATKLSLPITPQTATTAVVSGNVDLFTSASGYNQDIGIFVAVDGAAAQLLAWKESGGFAGTFSPNAAFVQTVYTMAATHTYVFTLRWKTNKPEPAGVIVYAAAGNGPYSPTRLTADVAPAPAQTFTAVSTQQYTLSGNDGRSWLPMDSARLVDTVTATRATTALVGGNVDLFTNARGYNQDVAIFVSIDGALDQLLAWKESGGFAGVFSPNAAFVQTLLPLTGGHTYAFSLRWKTNIAEQPGAVIFAGAGGPAPYSPTRLTVQLG